MPPARPTQADVARLAGVSRPLVSLVMREAPNVAPATRDRVLAAARAIGYRPNALARQLAQKSTGTIGVFINDVSNPHFGAVYSSIAAAAEAAGLDLLVAAGTRSAAREPALINTLLEHQVAGLVLLSPIMREATLAEFCHATPTVVVGREVALTGVDVVSTDERLAARRIVEHLASLGHTRITHISGGSDNRPAVERANAYRAAMREAGLEPLVVPGSFTPEGGQTGARALLDVGVRPTAIAAANDLVAVGAMGWLRQVGIRVPDDVSVVGFDDSQLASLELIQLTSVRQAIDRFGAIAIDMLVERMDGRRDSSRIERVEPTLRVRATTAPVAGHLDAMAAKAASGGDI